MKGNWVQKSNDDTVVIWVHGILSSGEECWQNKKGSYWPSMLKNEELLNQTGNYVFTYYTGVFSGTYKIGDAVDSLKEFMKIDKVLNHSNLIFVCHSMGGIVVRKYLVERASELIEGNKKIGLFLIASPSLGSEYANWLSPIAQFMGHSQGAALTFVRNNEWLSDLDKQFINLKESNKLPIKGKELIEDKFIILKSLFKRQVVEPFSGARYFGEQYKVPKSDHFSIAKPLNQNDTQHRILVETIIDWKNSFDELTNQVNPIDIKSSKNVVSGNINIEKGNLHIGDNIYQQKEGLIKWGGISLFKAEEEKYTSDINNNTIKIVPKFSLQEIADWPGRYGEEFPLLIDMKFLNSGDSSRIINEIRVLVKDVDLDNLPAFEQEVSINQEGNLVFRIENYGWGKNEIIDFKLFSGKALSVLGNVNQLSLNSIDCMDGHIEIEMDQLANCDLKSMSEGEFEEFSELYNATNSMWTPNPSELLFDTDTAEKEIENEFTKFRNALIAERKILDSKSFFGQLMVEANGKIITRKLNWGYISHQGASFDLMIVHNVTSSSYKLFRYQELLAPLPPSAEYNLELSVKDKGKTLIIDEPHILKGGEGDRIIVKIKSKEALFANLEVSIKTDDDKITSYPKNLELNMLRFKDNGREEISQDNSIENTKYFFDSKSIRKILP